MYQLTHSDAVVRILDGAVIPADPANSDRQRYDEWLADGHTPQPAEVVPGPSPQEQIEALEREHMAPGWQRAFILGSMEREAAEMGAAQGLTAPQSIALMRSKNPGYRRLKELDEQIEALRASQ